MKVHELAGYISGLAFLSQANPKGNLPEEFLHLVTSIFKLEVPEKDQRGSRTAHPGHGKKSTATGRYLLGVCGKTKLCTKDDWPVGELVRVGAEKSPVKYVVVRTKETETTAAPVQPCYPWD